MSAVHRKVQFLINGLAASELAWLAQLCLDVLNASEPPDPKIILSSLSRTAGQPPSKREPASERGERQLRLVDKVVTEQIKQELSAAQALLTAAKKLGVESVTVLSVPGTAELDGPDETDDLLSQTRTHALELFLAEWQASIEAVRRAIGGRSAAQ